MPDWIQIEASHPGLKTLVPKLLEALILTPVDKTPKPVSESGPIK